MKEKFEEQIQEIFGTTDLNHLRKIAEDAAGYKKQADLRKSSGGRKNTFTDVQRAEILALQENGMDIAKIARKYAVSRQTIYNQICKAYQFSDDPDVRMRMNYMNRMNLCTAIDIDFLHERIRIQNYTDQIPLRAFGVVERPTWDDFQLFLEDRCFPKTRDHAKQILKEMGVPFYDPLLIIEKTKGEMAGDHQWIMILKKRGAGDGD